MEYSGEEHIKAKKAKEKARKAEYYKKNKEKIDARNLAYSRTPDAKLKAIARNKKYSSNNPGRRKIYEWKCDGLPLPTRPMPQVCEICGNPETDKDKSTGIVRSLALDHCHDSNEFRGWLCRKCNTGLGLLGDSEDAILRALEYLRKGK